jgi:hypothetical protein
MNYKAEDAANKIMLAFQSGGNVPLEPNKYSEIGAHVRHILGRAMESKAQKKQRKWTSFQRAMAERQ